MTLSNRWPIQVRRGIPPLTAGTFAFALVLTAGSAAGVQPTERPGWSGSEPSGPSGTWRTDALRDRLDPDLLRSEQSPTSTSGSAGPSVVGFDPPAYSDVDGDGIADLVARLTGPDGGRLQVRQHSGDPGDPWSGDAQATEQSFEFADLVLLADVTGDGRADVLARDSTHEGTLWIYPHDGSTSANPWTSRFNAGTGWNFANIMRIGDVDGDGHTDLVVRDASRSNGQLLVHLGNGATSSNPWTSAPIHTGTGWNLAETLSLADATGDGRLDIVARDGTGRLLVYPHNGATSSNFWTSIVIGSSGWSGSGPLNIADVDGDGRPDIVARRNDGSLVVHPYGQNEPNSMWSAEDGITVLEGLESARDVLTGDVDGDGRSDVITRTRFGEDIEVRFGDGSAAGDPWTDGVRSSGEWGFAAQILLADVDGDGLRDLLAVDPSADNGTLWIYPNNGTADPWDDRRFGGTGWNTYTRLITGDVTGDGRDDLVGLNQNGALYAYASNGLPTGFPWEPRVWVGSNWNGATHLTLGDVDRDGVADLIALESDKSLWLFATSDPGSAVSIGGDWSETVAVDVGDITGSGRLDLVAEDDAGGVWIHSHSGETTGDPWTGPRRQAATGLEDVLSIAI